MSLDNFKPAGAFVENTIRPMMREFSDLVYEFSKIDLIPGKEIPKILRGLFVLAIFTAITDVIKSVLCTAIIGYAAWMICRS